MSHDPAPQPVSSLPRPLHPQARRPGRLFLATRPLFFPASVLPILLGTAWGARDTAGFDSIALALALAAIAFIHAGANVLNDECDARAGCDASNPGRIPPYTGGSRYIQDGILGVEETARLSRILFAGGLIVGAMLAVLKGPVVLILGFIGVAIAILYSVPPIRLSDHGLGEAAVAIAFGVLPVTGAAWLQSGAFTIEAVLISFPLSLWIASTLLINEVPDTPADMAAGKRTLAVRAGTGGTRILYLSLQGLAFAFAGLLVGLGLFPWLFLTGPAVLAGSALYAARTISATSPPRSLKRGIKTTLAIHAAGGLWMTAWTVLAL